MAADGGRAAQGDGVDEDYMSYSKKMQFSIVNSCRGYTSQLHGDQ